MSKDLYLGLYHLINSQVNKAESARQQFLDDISEDIREGLEVNPRMVEIVARENDRFNEYMALLKMFDEEVEVPEELR